MGGKVKKSTALPGAIVISILIMMLVSCALILLLTGLVIRERVGECACEKLLLLAWLLVGVCGGVCGIRMEAQKKLYVSVGACGLFACMMLIGSMLLFEGRLVRPWLPVGIMIVGSIAVNVFGVAVGGKRKRKIRSR